MTDEPPPRRRRVSAPPEGSGVLRAAPAKLKPDKLRSESSRRWLQRQLADPYVARAKADGWRSRAAYKLMELDDRWGFLRKGARVADLGAAPGGWSQVAMARGAASVVGIDLLPVDPLAGLTFIQGDFLDDADVARLIAALGGPPDIVLSDMAANTVGHRATDHLRTVALAEAAAAFALEHVAPGGAFCAKVFQGGSEGALLARLKQGFAEVRHAKPKASRQESPELFVVATGRKRAGP
jgi:23S rRNA (uridine2552-2'-O)-methyltransferase